MLSFLPWRLCFLGNYDECVTVTRMTYSASDDRRASAAATFPGSDDRRAAAAATLPPLILRLAAFSLFFAKRLPRCIRGVVLFPQGRAYKCAHPRRLLPAKSLSFPPAGGYLCVTAANPGDRPRALIVSVPRAPVHSGRGCCARSGRSAAVLSANVRVARPWGTESHPLESIIPPDTSLQRFVSSGVPAAARLSMYTVAYPGRGRGGPGWAQMILRGVAVLGAALAALRGRCSVPGFVCPRVRLRRRPRVPDRPRAAACPRPGPPRPAALKSAPPGPRRPRPCVAIWAGLLLPRVGMSLSGRGLAGRGNPLPAQRAAPERFGRAGETVGEEMRMRALWRPPGAVFSIKGGGFLIHPPEIASTGRKNGA